MPLIIVDVKEDFKHSQLAYTGSARTMELDVFVPGLKLAFEYQVKQIDNQVVSLTTQRVHNIIIKFMHWGIKGCK